MIFKNCSELVGRYQIQHMYLWYDMSVYACDLRCNWCHGRTGCHPYAQKQSLPHREIRRIKFDGINIYHAWS